MRRFGPALAVLLAQLALFPLPVGVYLRGIIVGLLSALAALGLALIYRANRIINFAQTDLGSVPTAVGVYLIAFSGLSYWLAWAPASSPPSPWAPSSTWPSCAASSTPPV